MTPCVGLDVDSADFVIFEYKTGLHHRDFVHCVAAFDDNVSGASFNSCVRLDCNVDYVALNGCGDPFLVGSDGHWAVGFEFDGAGRSGCRKVSVAADNRYCRFGRDVRRFIIAARGQARGSNHGDE